MQDQLQKFMFEHAAIRGELVEISEAWQQVQARHDYPDAVKTLLGEMLAAAALLSANLKFNGTLIMQIHGDGPVRLLVVECDSELQLRATAKLAPNAVISPNAQLSDLVHVHGNGRFIMTLAPKNPLPGQQVYQGIVPLNGDNIASVIEYYMQHSEQLDTKLWLAANQHVTRGLLLQKLPHQGGTPQNKDENVDENLESNEDPLETWNRTVMLASTLKYEELLATDIQNLMHNLFWEETIRVFDAQHPSFHCSCNREKVGNMLKMLGQTEIEAGLAEQEMLDIACDFCGLHYSFDKIDCAQLFLDETEVDVITDTNHSKH